MQFPISPTALNQVVRNACARHVVVMAYDAEITEPCAHNVHIDQEEVGNVTANWLAKTLGGKGNIVMITGVPGTSVDTERTEAAKKDALNNPNANSRKAYDPASGFIASAASAGIKA